MPNVLAFGTPHERGFLEFGVPNAKFWHLAHLMRMLLGPSEDTSSFEETTWLKRSMLSLSLETKKKGPRSNLSSDTENPEQMYVQATEAYPLST